ncbi:MAG: hypothetical protein ACXVZW_03035 [Gaiellaceae bacterium]
MSGADFRLQALATNLKIAMSAALAGDVFRPDGDVAREDGQPTPSS